MAVTVTIPTKTPGKLANKEVDWDSDNIRVMAFSSSASFTQATTIYLSAIRAAELTGTGWAANGIALANKTTTDDGVKTTKLDADDISNATTTLTNVRYFAVVDYQTAVDATSPILLWIDLGVNTSWAAQTVDIIWPAGGILTQTVP